MRIFFTLEWRLELSVPKIKLAFKERDAPWENLTKTFLLPSVIVRQFKAVLMMMNVSSFRCGGLSRGKHRRQSLLVIAYAFRSSPIRVRQQCFLPSAPQSSITVYRDFLLSILRCKNVHQQKCLLKREKRRHKNVQWRCEMQIVVWANVTTIISQ